VESDDLKENGANERPVNLPVPAREEIPKIDTLYRYLQELSRYPLLTPEEELELTTKYHYTKNPELAYKIASSNLRLVVKIAFEYSMYAYQILDLIQEGNIGLLQAIRKFDPFKGVRFSHYAQYWIRSYIIYYLLNNHRLIKIGTTQAQRKIFFNLRKERQRLLNMGFEPTPKLLAERLDVPETAVGEMMGRLDASEVSLDAPVGDDRKTHYIDMISSGETPETEAAEKETDKIIKAATEGYKKTLKNERDIYIWENRLISGSPLTLQEIGDKLDISRERVRQIEERIKKNFKKFIEKNYSREIQLDFLK